MTDQFTTNDIEFLKEIKNYRGDYVYPKITNEEKPWLDLMIALAEYNLSFDVDISEEASALEMGEFDIEIDG
jgi:hypothetical protein